MKTKLRNKQLRTSLTALCAAVILLGFGRAGGERHEARQTAGQVVRGDPLQPRG